MKRIVVIVLLLAAIVVARVLAPKHRRHAAPKSPPAIAPVTPVAKPDQQPAFLKFTPDGLPGKMRDQVEMVVRPLHAQAGLCESEHGRFACVLVESPGPEKYVELDEGLRADSFPFLEKRGFVAPPPHTSKSMLSVYRSVAKTAMDYRADRGDRMIVLMCPINEWDEVQIPCLELNAAPQKIPAD